MKNFLKLIAAVIIVIAFAQNPANAQGYTPGKGFSQVNAGLHIGFAPGVYAGYEYGISDLLTIGTRFGYGKIMDTYDTYNYNSNEFLPSLRADYHFSGLINSLPDKLNFYAGASVGYYISVPDENNPYIELMTDESVEFWVQVGSRWYFSEKFAANVEFNPGTLKPNGMLGGYLSLGASLKL